MESYALGDWQTPPTLAREIVDASRRYGFTWSRVLEPTCGVGNFVEAVITDPAPQEVIGIDIQSRYIKTARQRFADAEKATLNFLEADFFTLDLERDVTWDSSGPLLVLGNPPWVTNAAISARGDNRRAPVSDAHGLSGLDAITGAANFDLTESISMKLLTQLPHGGLIVALLMKTSVARRVLTRAHKLDLPVCRALMVRIDAKASFGATVDACLLVLQLQSSPVKPEFPAVAVYESLRSSQPSKRMGFADGQMVADIDAYQQIAWADGASPVKWRQGIKHDAAEVLELTVSGDELRNRRNQVVEVESDWIYPLIKGSMLYNGNVADAPLRVILTQRSLADDTEEIAAQAPRLWSYLERHADVFARRKSRIYRSRPRFAMFGVGEYSFSDYKAAISGLHKIPRVRLVPPIEGRPAMLDDTCYFAESVGPAQAAILTALLNSEPALELLNALMFVDAKRPVTARLLRRINLSAILARLDRYEVLEDAAAALAAAAVSGVRLGDRDLDRFSPPARQMTLPEPR